MGWQDRKVALLGLGKSNMAVGKYLGKKGARITGLDQKTHGELGARAREAESLGFHLVLGPSYLDSLYGFNTIFLTPGIRKSLPQIKQAEREGATLSSEINLLFDVCRGTIIGITGSAGKTTTVSLTGEMLRRDGRRHVFVGGNIGTPLIEVAEEIPPEALVVLELSSFQLQLLRQSPYVGVILNISPNHLDIHDSMDEYVSSKKNIYRFAQSDEWAVLNQDSEATRAMAEEAATVCNVALFSRTGRVPVGSYLSGSSVVFSDGRRETMCGSVTERLIPGNHNVENILAATTAAMLCGAGAEAAAEAIRTFPGVEHRLELVRVLRGVRFYNDSIATAPDRTGAALDTVEGPVVLIAGGYDKGISFEALARSIVAKVKVLVLLGATSRKIAEEVFEVERAAGAPPFPTIVLAKSLAEAVATAAGMAQPGDAVLLSPACASFDLFRDFEERGRRFKQLVAAL
jgi:UDP-N-acetylmuramoylalanine--D-glutamate ligase